MKKIVFAIIGLILTTSCSRDYDAIVPTQSEEKNSSMNIASRATQQRNYSVSNVPATLNFTSISAASSFSVAASNTGNRTANFQVWSSVGDFIGSFNVAPGLSYTPVYYFTGTGGYVRIIVTRDHPSSGTVKGTVSVSN